MISAVFVYGTLQRGQCRQHLWPVQPLSVDRAWVHGRLFDRADYPALRSGRDRVLGEVWQFEPDDLSRVLPTLDVIEGTNQPPEPDLYRRVELQTYRTDDSLLVLAWAYHYATDPLLDRFRLLEPSNKNAWVCWP